MSREFKPGDVADVGVGRAMRHEDGRWVFPDGSHNTDRQNIPTHLLVVIDPEDREQVEDLCRRYVETYGGRWDGREKPVIDMQAALRSLIEPPKPEEPTGLGAVVETANGDLYVRSKTITTIAHWKPAKGGERRKYEHLKVVRVLSEGVTP